MKAVPLGVLGEAGRLDFRAEFFNIMNFVNFGVPDRLVYGNNANPLANAGLISATAGNSRQLQLSLRVSF